MVCGPTLLQGLISDTTLDTCTESGHQKVNILDL